MFRFRIMGFYCLGFRVTGFYCLGFRVIGFDCLVYRTLLLKYGLGIWDFVAQCLRII